MINNEKNINEKKNELTVRSQDRKDYRIEYIKGLDTLAALICTAIAFIIWLYN
jgi:hypothetical protein